MISRKSVDVSDKPELRRLAEEVERTGEATTLELAGRRIAIVSPAKARAKPRRPSKADYDRFMSSFGGWVGLVDAEELKRASRASRSITKPAPRL